MEQPVLRLGLLGFAEPESARLQNWATQVQPGWPEWRCADPHCADAWMISGAAVDVLGRDAVVIAHPQGSDERLTLNRAEVDRPLAFAAPLPEGFASAEHFDAENELSVRQRLQRFEAWLRPLRSQFALGAQLVQRVHEFKGEVVHLVHEGKLLAVIDFERWQAGLLIPARPVDLSMAEWVRRRGLSRDIPPSFIKLPLHRVLWTYAVRTQRDVLPQRYRELRIYLRRVPSIPARWFDEIHLQLLRELMARPATLADLGSRVGADPEALSHRLAALYFAGALTTDVDSARRAEKEVRRAVVALQLEQMDVAPSRPGHSDQQAPSSILRDGVHSPLRAASSDANVATPIHAPARQV